MKNLMKAIAFATVMCMILSTAAFAATTATNSVDSAEIATDKTVTVTVTGAGANAQVALVLVAGEVTTTSAISQSNIEYVDQQPADGSGDVTFGPITTKNEVEEVSVFVGYATAAAQYVGTVALEEEETTVSITMDVKKIVSNTRTELGEDVTAEALIGAGAAVTFTIPEGYAAEKMIWSLTVNDPVNPKRFSAPVEISSALQGDVELAVAFKNGNVNNPAITSYDVTDVDAIFRLKKIADNTYANAFTDSTDADRKTPASAGSEE